MRLHNVLDVNMCARIPQEECVKQMNNVVIGVIERAKPLLHCLLLSPPSLFTVFWMCFASISFFSTISCISLNMGSTMRVEVRFGW